MLNSLKSIYIIVLFSFLFNQTEGQKPIWNNFNYKNSKLPWCYYISNLAYDSKENLWISTYGGGLVKYDGKDWINYNSNNSELQNNYLKLMGIDDKNNVWIKLWDLIKFDSKNWEVIKNPEIPNYYNNFLVFDKSGEMWIGSETETNEWGSRLGENCLIRYDSLEVIKYNSSNSGLPDKGVKNIAFDKYGNKWICTWGGGLVKYDGLNWTIYNMSNSGLPDDYVRCVGIDKNNIKWIGTWSGLARFDDSTWTVFNSSNSPLPENDIKSIIFDSKGNKWMATYYYGIAKYNDTSWTIYNKLNSEIPSDYINSMVSDKNDHIWLATNNTLTELIENGKIDDVEESTNSNYSRLIIGKSDISYELQKRCHVSISIYDVAGRKIRTLKDESEDKGEQKVNFDKGELKTGVYFLRMITNDQAEVLKFVNW